MLGTMAKRYVMLCPSQTPVLQLFTSEQ